MFNLNITIAHNDLLCVATLASIQKTEGSKTSRNVNPLEAASQAAESQVTLNQKPQTLTTYYFFSQFWCEFTRHVLQEFDREDMIEMKLREHFEQ